MVKQNMDFASGTTARETFMLSALDLARRIEHGELPLAAVVGACADAIAAQEAEIGAFAALDLAGTERQAKSAGERLTTLPLRGLPIGVKDIIDTVDFPTSYGSPIYAGRRPTSDAPIVSMIRRAGGIVIGKTVTTPFAYLDPGKTRNPRNPAHTPGGSSSGSAAAVAAGMVPIALGTQTGGSIIRPAAFCGVAGFKPSFRLLPTAGIKCFSWSLDTAGVFAAGVADAAFATAAITGRDLRVDQQVPAPPRLALVRTHAWAEASDAMRAAIEGTARAAEAKGAQLSELVLPAIFEDAANAFAAIQGYEAWRAMPSNTIIIATSCRRASPNCSTRPPPSRPRITMPGAASPSGRGEFWRSRWPRSTCCSRRPHQAPHLRDWTSSARRRSTGCGP